MVIHSISSEQNTRLGVTKRCVIVSLSNHDTVGNGFKPFPTPIHHPLSTTLPCLRFLIDNPTVFDKVSP